MRRIGRYCYSTIVHRVSLKTPSSMGSLQSLNLASSHAGNRIPYKRSLHYFYCVIHKANSYFGSHTSPPLLLGYTCAPPSRMHIPTFWDTHPQASNNKEVDLYSCTKVLLNKACTCKGKEREYQGEHMYVSKSGYNCCVLNSEPLSMLKVIGGLAPFLCRQ